MLCLLQVYTLRDIIPKVFAYKMRICIGVTNVATVQSTLYHQLANLTGAWTPLTVVLCSTRSPT